MKDLKNQQKNTISDIENILNILEDEDANIDPTLINQLLHEDLIDNFKDYGFKKPKFIAEIIGSKNNMIFGVYYHMYAIKWDMQGNCLFVENKNAVPLFNLEKLTD